MSLIRRALNTARKRSSTVNRRPLCAGLCLVALCGFLLIQMSGCGESANSASTTAQHPEPNPSEGTTAAKAQSQTLARCLTDLDLEFQQRGTVGRIQTSDGALYATANLLKTTAEATTFEKQLLPNIEQGQFGRVVVLYNAGADDEIITSIETCLLTTNPAKAFRP